ncbi:RNA 2'-phosphotransferase [Planctomycetes bacterium Poly30]|uniref:Probable RNA 2'-phosphotransferase n=1 Tax=Saltatorellus ferox TaxID=2528018 RepID=A0A518EX09_9BACT|nr:RNA 2'-phosphotransferase [Planctomycetes bacterium Poly30]
MTSGSLHERITRALAFMLRHQPEDFDLELDRFGWGDLEDVLYALQERLGSSVDEDDVLDAIEASDRPRYEVDGDKIRALYGHSFPIDPGEATEPPDELFIGVGSRDAERAEEHGLRSGRRAFLHLARTEEEAREAGRRAAKDYAVITVYAGEAYDEGIDFYDRGSLFLADEVPTEFIEVGDIQHDGIERDARRSRGRRSNEGPRGGGGRRGRGRGRGRGHYEEDDRGPRDRDRAGRGDRSERDERPAAPREEARKPEPPREEPRREAPVREEAPRKPAPREESRTKPQRESNDRGGFGLGLDSDKPKREQRPAPRGESTTPREEKPAAKKPEPAPRKEEKKEDKKASAPGFGFGAGI